MDSLGVVVAGCALAEPDCAVGTAPPDIDVWFIVLLLVVPLVMVAVVAGRAVLLRRRLSRDTEVASGPRDPTAKG